MNIPIEGLLALFLLSCLMLAASSRLLHCIRIVALQGILLGVLPLLLQDAPEAGVITASVLNISIKGICLPMLLMMAMKKADVRRELEPLVGYASSLLIVLGGFAISFWISGKLPPAGNAESLKMTLPVAFSVMFTGLFIVMARRKAITQSIGFLTFENGIALFGTGMMLECGLAVELGILLDVFVLVFVMGIAVMRINREFEHIDADKLHQLGDIEGGTND